MSQTIKLEVRSDNMSDWFETEETDIRLAAAHFQYELTRLAIENPDNDIVVEITVKQKNDNRYP